MDLCLSLLQVHVLMIPWLPYSWSFLCFLVRTFFCQACRVQGMMGEMMRLKSLSQVYDGFMPFFVTSTHCFTVGHFCASWYVHFVAQVHSVQGMMGRMIRVQSPSQVHVRDGFVPFFNTLAALDLVIFLSGMQSARNDGRDDASGISESGTCT